MPGCHEEERHQRCVSVKIDYTLFFNLKRRPYSGVREDRPQSINVYRFAYWHDDLEACVVHPISICDAS